MCKIIYDDKIHELLGVRFFADIILIRTQYEGRHIIANDNFLHGR